MKIAKAKFHGQPSYNDYELELSWGQLQAIYRALEKDHADPLADELFAELGYYLANVPGPGEDEEEYKQAKEAEKQSIESGQTDDGEVNPELVGQEMEEPPPGEGMEEPEGAESPAGRETPEEVNNPTKAEADSYLDRPPAEHALAA